MHERETTTAARSPAGVASLLGLGVVGALTALAVLIIDYQELVVYIGLISLFVHAVSQATAQLTAALESLGASCDAALMFVLVTFCYSIARAGDALALQALDGGTVGGGVWEVYVVGASHTSLVAVGLSPVLLFVPRYGFIRWFAQNRYVASALRIAGSPAVRRTSFAIYACLVLVLLSNAYACFQLLREAGLANEEVVLFLVLYALLVAATFIAAFERLMDIPLAALLSRAATLPLLRALRYESVLNYSVDSNVAQTILGWSEEAARLSADGAVGDAAAAGASASAALLRAATGWDRECTKARVLELARWADETATSARDALSVVQRVGELGARLEPELVDSLVGASARGASALHALGQAGGARADAADEPPPATVFEAARLLVAQVDEALPIAKDAALSLSAATHSLALAAARAFASGVQSWAAAAAAAEEARPAGGGPPAAAPRSGPPAHGLPVGGGGSLLCSLLSGCLAAPGRERRDAELQAAQDDAQAASALLLSTRSQLAEAAAALAALGRLLAGACALVVMGGRELAMAVAHSHNASALARLDTAMAMAERAGEAPRASLARALLPSGGAQRALHALLEAGAAEVGDGKVAWQRGWQDGASVGNKLGGAVTRIGTRLRGGAEGAVALVQRLQTRMYVTVPEYRYVYAAYALLASAEAARRAGVLARWALSSELRVIAGARALGVCCAVLSLLLVAVHLLVAFLALGGKLRGQSAQSPPPNALERAVENCARWLGRRLAAAARASRRACSGCGLGCSACAQRAHARAALAAPPAFAPVGDGRLATAAALDEPAWLPISSGSARAAAYRAPIAVAAAAAGAPARGSAPTSAPSPSAPAAKQTESLARARASGASRQRPAAKKMASESEERKTGVPTAPPFRREAQDEDEDEDEAADKGWLDAHERPEPPSEEAAVTSGATTAEGPLALSPALSKLVGVLVAFHVAALRAHGPAAGSRGQAADVAAVEARLSRSASALRSGYARAVRQAQLLVEALDAAATQAAAQQATGASLTAEIDDDRMRIGDAWNWLLELASLFDAVASELAAQPRPTTASN